MTLGERMLNYRARHRLSQRQLAELLGEKHITSICRIEKNICKPHKSREIRLSQLMDKLETEERSEEQ